MQNPLEITFHDIGHDPVLENLVQEKYEKLRGVAPNVTKCHVILEKLSKHHHTANACCVRMDLKIPHFDDIVIAEKCEEGEASLSSTIIKVFKRGSRLMKKDMQRRTDRHRVPRPDKFEVGSRSDAAGEDE